MYRKHLHCQFKTCPFPFSRVCNGSSTSVFSKYKCFLSKDKQGTLTVGAEQAAAERDRVETGRAHRPPTSNPFEKHGESNTTEAAARETTTATATATRMIGRGSTARRSGRGGRRQPEVGRDKIHDPRRRYSPPPPCLDFCSFLASVLVSTRLDLPGFPPALCNCDLGAAGEPTLLLRPIALGFARSSSDRPAAAVEVTRSRA
jgi:hypothetical protein